MLLQLVLSFNHFFGQLLVLVHAFLVQVLVLDDDAVAAAEVLERLKVILHLLDLHVTK